MRKTFIGIVMGIILAGGSTIAFAVGAFQVATGGTGTTTVTANQVILGNGTSPFKTASVGSNGQYFVYFNGVPTWITASSTASITATTSPFVTGQVAFANANGSLSTTATTTLSGSGVITVTAGASVLGVSPITVACATCSTTSGTVTSITGGTGLNGGTITNSGTLSMVSYLATSTPDIGGQLMYWSTTNGTPAKISSVATTTLNFSPAYATSTNIGTLVGGSSGVVSSIIQPSFTLTGTSTGAGIFAPILGTTTLPLQQVLLSETVQGVSCRTDTGTVNVQFGQGSASTTMLTASTTNNFNAFTTNNTPTFGNSFSVDVGTPVSSPTKVNCTVKIKI